MIADIEAESYSPCYANFLRKFQIKALAIATLQSEQRPWGLLKAHSCTTSRSWQPAEIEALRNIALYLGIAIQQAVLRTQVQAALPQTSLVTWQQDQRQQAQLAAIVESSQAAIISKTLDGRINSWNQAAEHLFGYTAAEAIGQPITTIIPPDHRDEAAHILARIRQGQRVETYETQRRHKDGHLVEVSLTVSPIYGENGEVVGASKIARDITAHKRNEHLRQQAEKAPGASQERFQQLMENAPPAELDCQPG